MLEAHLQIDGVVHASANDPYGINEPGTSLGYKRYLQDCATCQSHTELPYASVSKPTFSESNDGSPVSSCWNS